tara:strand:- start:4730 stop:5023 length:294 start_codon:yes stop_codon:yes gene_type:complete
MKIEKLQKKLLQVLSDFIKENQIEFSGELSLNSRMIGTSSIFDSMELVTFIVEVEQLLDDEYDFQTQLASEKAMSRRTSPFISLSTLSQYIIEDFNE